jgi:DNA polymerase I-like protein with 3'-5' exonuclease and polymerase domains/5'-3' exonuclease
MTPFCSLKFQKEPPMKTYTPDTVVLIDHKAIMKHSYYGASDQQGIYSAVRDKTVATAEYAFASYIQRYIEPMLLEFSPRQIIVAHDMGQDYRSRLLPEYKCRSADGDRCEIEDAEIEKLHTYLTKFFKLAGITQVGAKGVEADDVIAYLCQLRGQKLVRTVDADLLGLVNEDTFVYLKEVMYTDSEWYKDMFPLGGEEGNVISISKAMLGDTSDGYKGIPGFGPAKWEQLVEAVGYDGIQEIKQAVETNDKQTILDAAAAMPIKPLTLIADNWDEFRLQWNLAKLHPELCWKPQGKKLPKLLWTRRLADPEGLKQLMYGLNCSDLYHEVMEAHMPVRYLLDANSATPDFIAAIKSEMKKSPFIAFDFEAFDPNEFECFKENDSGFVDVLSQKITGMGITFGANLESTVYVTVGHKTQHNCDIEVLRDLLLFAYQNKPIVAHNALFEITLTSTNLGEILAGVYDTQIMSSYVDENSRSGLKYLSKSILNYDQVSYNDTLAAANANNMAELTPDQVFGYGADDPVVTAYLFDHFHRILELENTIDFYVEHELYTANVLHTAFEAGQLMDKDLMKLIYETDEKTVAEGIDKLRAILDTHCVEENQLDFSGADTLIELERSNQRDLFKAKFAEDAKNGKAPEGVDSARWIKQQVEANLERWEQRIKSAVPYTPLVTEELPVLFAPTPKQLNVVTTAIGLPPIEKDTQKAVSEWLAEVTLTEEGELRQLYPDQARFCNLLGGAIKDLKRREGEAYEAFAEFCKGYFEPKTVTSGDELSLGSPKQMQDLLYCKLALPLRLRTKPQKGSARDLLRLDGSPGTDDKCIKMALANDCGEGFEWKRDALNIILEVKAAQTRIGLYHKPYPNWIRPDTGKMHPSIRNCGTVTRRPAGGSPNILQVSKGTLNSEIKLAMRSMFIPPHPDYVAVPIDFSGQELRIMACQTMDENLLSVYGVTKHPDGTYTHSEDDEKDLHGMTASGILDIGYEEFIVVYSDPNHPDQPLYTKVRGKKAKGTNFGLSYGAGADTLSRNLTVPVEEAKELLDAAHAKYPGIGRWQEASAEFARKWGFTRTAFGTRRHMTEDIFSKDAGARSRLERQGANFEIQGTAADMLKKVMSGMWKTNLLKDVRMVFFAPIYDEIVSWVHVDDVWEYCVRMEALMSGATPPGHIVPQVPEFSIGCDWGNLQELGRLPDRETIETAAKVAWQQNQERLYLWEPQKLAA